MLQLQRPLPPPGWLSDLDIDRLPHIHRRVATKNGLRLTYHANGWWYFWDEELARAHGPYRHAKDAANAQRLHEDLGDI